MSCNDSAVVSGGLSLQLCPPTVHTVHPLTQAYPLPVICTRSHPPIHPLTLTHAPLPAAPTSARRPRRSPRAASDPAPPAAAVVAVQPPAREQRRTVAQHLGPSTRAAQTMQTIASPRLHRAGGGLLRAGTVASTGPAPAKLGAAAHLRCEQQQRLGGALHRPRFTRIGLCHCAVTIQQRLGGITSPAARQHTLSTRPDPIRVPGS